MGECNSKEAKGECGDPNSKCNHKPDRADKLLWTDCYRTECVGHYSGNDQEKREQAMRADCAARGLKFTRQYKDCGDHHWQALCAMPTRGGGGPSRKLDDGDTSGSAAASAPPADPPPSGFTLPPREGDGGKDNNNMVMMVGGGILLVVMMMMLSSGDKDDDDDDLYRRR